MLELQLCLDTSACLSLCLFFNLACNIWSFQFLGPSTQLSTLTALWHWLFLWTRITLARGWGRGGCRRTWYFTSFVSLVLCWIRGVPCYSLSVLFTLAANNDVSLSRPLVMVSFAIIWFMFGRFHIWRRNCCRIPTNIHTRVYLTAP